MHSMKIKRQLPPAPPTATKPVRNNRMFGHGAHVYEAPIPSSQIELLIPPTRSNSSAAQAERDAKIILDLAREGKTASEIMAETGFTRNRIMSTVNRFAEYGAKIKPDNPKKRADNKIQNVVRASKYRWWTEERVTQLIDLHGQGLIYEEIAQIMGTNKSAVTSKVKTLIDRGILEARIQKPQWTEEEIRTLVSMKAEGKTWAESGDKVHRNAKTCEQAWRRERDRKRNLQAVLDRMADSRGND